MYLRLIRHQFFVVKFVNVSLKVTLNLVLGDCPVIERWFTKLPPVLILELSRFQYNLKRNFVEKLHNQMDFPEILYMDRYMVQNKHLTT